MKSIYNDVFKLVEAEKSAISKRAFDVLNAEGIADITENRRGKDGRYRKTTKLLQSNLFWLDYMLQEKGFIRKAKAR